MGGCRTEKTIEEVVEEAILRKVAVVVVAERFVEHVELNVKETVNEEMELEIIRLAEGKCKYLNQMKI